MGHSNVHLSPSRSVTLGFLEMFEIVSQSWLSGGSFLKPNFKSLIAAACLSGLMAGTVTAVAQQDKNADQQTKGKSEKGTSKSSTSKSGNSKSADKDKNTCGGKNGCGSKPK